MASAPDPRHTLHIARQAILDAHLRVCGYELLYRARQGDEACSTGERLASARVMTDAVLGIGLGALTGGLPAFIKFSRELLLLDVASLLPAESFVLELGPDVGGDAEVVAMCRELRGRGYNLALDRYTVNSEADALVPFAKYVKLDVRNTPMDMWQAAAHRLNPSSLQVIATQVESIDAATRARDAGCSLFQGYYYCRPATLSTKALPARRLAYLNLFAAINRPDLSFDQLEDLVKRDVSLTVQVLRSINSAAFPLRQRIASVRHALQLLGMQQIRKWASVWAIAGLNGGGAAEVVSLALLRARTCEVLGNATSTQDAGPKLFLLGMCSLLDTILDQPMDKAIADIPLAPDIRHALLGGSNGLRKILDAVVAHEQGDWTTAGHTLQGLGMQPTLLPEAYTEALCWARDIASSAVAA